MFNVGYNMTGMANMKKSYANKIFKQALIGMGHQWWKKYYPLRFDPKGKNRYHLKNRTVKYKRFVTKIFPNWRPLYRTGELRDISTRNGRVIASTAKGNLRVKVTLQRGHPTQKYVSEELTKILKKELKVLMKDFHADVKMRIRNAPQEAFKKGSKRIKGPKTSPIRFKSTRAA